MAVGWLTPSRFGAEGERLLPRVGSIEPSPASRANSSDGLPEGAAERPPALLYRLWATRPDSGDSVLLEESKNPLTSPVWRSDGKRDCLWPVGTRSGRTQSVRGGGPGRSREQTSLFLKQTPVEGVLRPADLPSPDSGVEPPMGGTLPSLSCNRPRDRVILRVDDGRILKEVPDAFLPSWSPDGTKLAFLRGGESQSLHYLDTNFGTPRHSGRQSARHVSRRPGRGTNGRFWWSLRRGRDRRESLRGW